MTPVLFFLHVLTTAFPWVAIVILLDQVLYLRHELEKHVAI
jgi:hypothetical protein